MRWLVALVALAGCDLPPFQLAYRYSGGPAQSCAPPAQPSGVPVTCDLIPLACDAVLSVRVITPQEPNAPHVGVCRAIPKNPTGSNPSGNDLCSIASIDLPTGDVPKETLEVQVAVWPKGAVEVKPNEYNCRPYPLEYDRTDGYLVPPPPGMSSPGLGGRAFFHPGDDRVTVTLGCADLEATNAICAGATSVTVQTTVEDFDTTLSVGPEDGKVLAVRAGRPREVGGAFVMTTNDSRVLGLTSEAPTPVWAGDVDVALKGTACVSVLDDGAETTTTVRCRTIPSDATTVMTTGTRLAKDTLKRIVTALGLGEFPATGLTVGIVLDQGLAQPGFAVEPSETTSTILYLNEARNGFVGTQTSANGIFVSTDAPFGTHFEATNGSANTLSVVGGLIAGKVTIVVLEVTPGNL